MCVYLCLCEHVCVSPTSAPLCLCSLLHPTRHSCLLFMGTRTAGRPSRAFSQWANHNIWVWRYTFTHMHTHTHMCEGRYGRQTQTLLPNMFMLCCDILLDTISFSQPEMVNRAKTFLPTLLPLAHTPTHTLPTHTHAPHCCASATNHHSSIGINFCCISLSLSLSLRARTTLMNGKRRIFTLYFHTISLCDNHILTVQMRKWLIGLVINIMSYYPGQRNYFIKPRLYLSVFTYAPVPLISPFLPITREITVSFRSAATRWLVCSRGNVIGYKLFPFVLENAYSWVPKPAWNPMSN